MNEYDPGNNPLFALSECLPWLSVHTYMHTYELLCFMLCCPVQYYCFVMGLRVKLKLKQKQINRRDELFSP